VQHDGLVMIVKGMVEEAVLVRDGAEKDRD
jgi:hypothetical protein